MAYPTPPPTGSPKHSSPHDYPYPRYPTSSPLPPQSSYAQYPTSKLPAQDSYYHDTYPPRNDSYPIPSPSSADPLNNPYQYSGSTHQPFTPLEQYQPQVQTYPQPLSQAGPLALTAVEPRPSSPLILSASSSPRPNSKPSKPYRITTPKPLHYSPSNRPPSPYNASRPKPRPAFVRRTLDKISSWIRSFTVWATSNPIKAGLLTFIPVAVGAGLVRGAREIGKGLGIMGNGKATKGLAKGREKAGKTARKWGGTEFVGFNGSKGGVVDGLLKIFHMWINHICRVSPSMVPRTASILLELYFLDLVGKKA